MRMIILGQTMTDSDNIYSEEDKETDINDGVAVVVCWLLNVPATS